MIVSDVRSRSIAELCSLGGIDIWVNNAGIYPRASVLDLDHDEWDRSWR